MARTPEQIADIIATMEQETGVEIYLAHPWAVGLDWRVRSRSIFVFGVARSGTSVVAGILHHLGVSMLQGTVPKGTDSPTGTFEDQNFVLLGIQRNDDPYNLNAEHRQLYANMIRMRQSQFYLWGVKEVRLMYVFRALLPVLEDPRIIFVQRSLDSIYASWEHPGTKDRLEAPPLASQLQAYNDLLTVDLPSLVLQYEDVVARPGEAVGKVAEFAYQGFPERPLPWQYVRAERFVDPGLKHY